MKQTDIQIKVIAVIALGLALMQVACVNAAPAINVPPASPSSDKWLPLTKNALHDPANPAIRLLQEPGEGLSGLPADQFGTVVNWVKALATGAITPRRAITAPGTGVEVEELVMDMDMYLNLGGSMPIVRFPHLAHTMWLSCANCHQAPVTNIFVPQAGANPIRMEKILEGEQCGICHSAVAFSLTECSRCHSVQHSSQEGARAKEMARARTKAKDAGVRP